MIKTVDRLDRLFVAVLRRLEPCAGKLASTVLRRGGDSNVFLLSDR